MKTALIIFFLLQVIDFHLCEEDEGLDTDLTAEERLEMEAAMEEADRMEAEDRADDILRPDNFCGNGRFRECRRKLFREFRWAKEEAGENVNHLFRILNRPIGRCKPCICRALYTFGERVFGKKITVELMLKFPCYDS